MIFEINADAALILTNHHVIENASDIQVQVNDISYFSAELLGTDSVRDLAVLRVCCGEFNALSFGNVSELDAGDEIFAMGYPLGLEGEATVTRGIVSAIRYDENRRSLVIQTDAAINPGNSGGPMLSETGEILGINTFAFRETQTGTNLEGLNFAIAAPTIQEQIPTLKSTSTLQATPTQVPTPVPTRTPRGGDSFGPISGEFHAVPEAEGPERVAADVILDDLLVEVTFINPRNPFWIYALAVRIGLHDGTADALFVGVDGRGEFQVETLASDETIDSGGIASLRLGEGEENHLMLIALGDVGWFFVNQTHVASFDLYDLVGAGEVFLSATVASGEGTTIEYENFRGNSLTRHYGPVDGTVGPDSGELALDSIWVSHRDLVAVADFDNPLDGLWNYGFVFRASLGQDFVADSVLITSRGKWIHYTEKENVPTISDSGELFNWKADPGESNRLIVVAIEDTGWLLMNGGLESRLDLSHNVEEGGVIAVSGLYGLSNRDVEFTDFTVWGP